MEHIELLAKYRAQTLAFVGAAKAFKTEDLNTAPAGEWSAAFVIHHLADVELQFGIRYANALVEDNPAIIPFDEDKFPIGLKYAQRSVSVSIQAFTSVSTLNYEILKNSTVEDWARSSTHPQSGKKTLLELVAKSTKHIESHIAQLQGLSAAG
jgi:hypothetical protein